MIFRARATRGLGRPSLDARSGRSISPHPWRGNELAWRELFIWGRCSSDARSAGQSGDSPALKIDYFEVCG